MGPQFARGCSPGHPGEVATKASLIAQTGGPDWWARLVKWSLSTTSGPLPPGCLALMKPSWPTGVKFRVGRIVYLAFSRDESVMGFAFPKEEREVLVSSEPAKFHMPSTSDMRYNWAHVRLDAIDDEEMRELVLDAWQMVVPKKVAAEYLGLRAPAQRHGKK